MTHVDLIKGGRKIREQGQWKSQEDTTPKESPKIHEARLSPLYSEWGPKTHSFRREHLGVVSLRTQMRDLGWK